MVNKNKSQKKSIEEMTKEEKIDAMKKIKIWTPIMIIVVPIIAFIIFGWYLPYRFAEYSDVTIILTLQMIIFIGYIIYFGIYGIIIIISILKYFKLRNSLKES